MIQQKRKISGQANLSLLTMLQYTVYGSLVLYFGRQIFVPISFALLISFVLYPMCAWMERRGIGRMTSIIVNVGWLALLMVLMIFLLFRQVIDFTQEWQNLYPRLTLVAADVNNFAMTSFGINQDILDGWLAKIVDQIPSVGIEFIKQTISASASSAVIVILIPVYVILILYFRNVWLQVLIRIFPAQDEEHVRTMLTQTINTYYAFIKGMGVVYFTVGILNSLGLWMLGIPHAFLFGFITSILTFIPYVGIIAGSLLPVALAWATHDSIWYPVGVVGVFTFVQYLEANIIFPFAVSSRLKVNTLSVLVAIFLGGILWGVAGMILFVPFVGIIKLIADNNPDMSTVSLMLGDGNKNLETQTKTIMPNSNKSLIE